MFDVSFVFLFKSGFFLIFLFWLLTVVGSSFYNTESNKVKQDFYECGFKSLSDYCFTINTSVLVVMVFVVLYDIELLFLIPYLVCYDYYTIYKKTSILFFILCIFLTFVIDMYEDVIEWNFSSYSSNVEHRIVTPKVIGSSPISYLCLSTHT